MKLCLILNQCLKLPQGLSKSTPILGQFYSILRVFFFTGSHFTAIFQKLKEEKF